MFVVCGVDLVQSILILICSYNIMDLIKKNNLEEIKKLSSQQ